MLSYKEWKSINESYDFSLGLATPASVGVVGSSFEEILEAKNKMKKKMSLGTEEGDDDMDDEEDDAETGDGEVVEPSAKKDVPDDEDMGDDEGDEEMGDDEEGDEDREKMGNPLLAGMKKKMKKMKSKMKKKMASGAKKCSKMKEEAAPASTTAETQVTPEDNAWWKSIQSMMGSDLNQKYSDGIGVTEDSLLPLIDPNTGLAVPEGEPRPGDVGYAPQTRFGIGS